VKLDIGPKHRNHAPAPTLACVELLGWCERERERGSHSGYVPGHTLPHSPAVLVHMVRLQWRATVFAGHIGSHGQVADSHRELLAHRRDWGPGWDVGRVWGALTPPKEERHASSGAKHGHSAHSSCHFHHHHHSSNLPSA
jgi:hypothetical protein